MSFIMELPCVLYDYKNFTTEVDFVNTKSKCSEPNNELLKCNVSENSYPFVDPFL